MDDSSAATGTSLTASVSATKEGETKSNNTTIIATQIASISSQLHDLEAKNEELESKYIKALERIKALEKVNNNLQAQLKTYQRQSYCKQTTTETTQPEDVEHIVLVEQKPKRSFPHFQATLTATPTVNPSPNPTTANTNTITPDTNKYTYVPYGKSIRKVPHKAQRAVLIKFKTDPPLFGKGKYANGQLARQCLLGDCDRRGMPEFDKMCHECYQSINPIVVSKYKGGNKCNTPNCPKRNQGRKYRGYCIQCFKTNFPTEEVPYDPCRAEGCAKRGKNGQFKGYCHTCFRGLFPGEPVRKTRSSCLTDGCDMLTPGRAWGKLCIACYKKTGRKLPDNYFCTTAGCNKAKEKRGYCVQHFREAHPGEQPWTTCSNGGCQKNGQGKKFDGMCRACFKETYDDEKKCRDGG